MGTIGFFEIRVDDFERAQAFYREVFGWKFTRSQNVPYDHFMIQTGEGLGLKQGGMVRRQRPLLPNQGESGYVCMIIVDSIDKALESIPLHGGTVTSQKAHIPAGWFAYALDTEGNVISVWEVERPV